jgi:peptide/nickel transport system permease protein
MGFDISKNKWLQKITSNHLLKIILSRLFMVWIVITLTFFIVRALPGNPIDIFVTEQMEKFGLSEREARQRASTVLCFDVNGSLDTQYLKYLGNILRGDLGNSCAVAPNESVIELVLANLPWTLFSVGTSLVISFLIGMLLGMFAAYQRNTGIDHLITNLSAVIDSIPNTLTAVIFIFLVGVVWNLTPASEMRGALSPRIQPGFNLVFIADVLKHYIWPGSIYILTTVGGWALAMRSNTLSVLGEDYVMAARARGLTDMRILTVYIGRNACLPLVTSLGISLGFVVGGSVLIEKIFVYRGVGSLLLTAIEKRDYPLIQGILLLTTITVILSTLLVETLYTRLDPRMRTHGIQGD